MRLDQIREELLAARFDMAYRAGHVQGYTDAGIAGGWPDDIVAGGWAAGDIPGLDGMVDDLVGKMSDDEDVALLMHDMESAWIDGYIHGRSLRRDMIRPEDITVTVTDWMPPVDI